MDKIDLYKGQDGLLHVGSHIVPSGAIIASINGDFISIRLYGKTTIVPPTLATDFSREDNSSYSTVNQIKTVLVDFFLKATSAEVANNDAIALANLAFVLSL